MNIKEMRDLPSDELLSEIDKAREKVFRMRFQAKGKDLEHPGQLTVLKKDIARMYTVLSERQARAQAAKPASSAAPASQAGEGSR